MKKEDDISCACDEETSSSLEAYSTLVLFKRPIISTIIFILAYLIKTILDFQGNEILFLALMLISYLIVAYDVLNKARKLALNLDIFNEFTLMSLATLGAFYIGEYLEGVFVMLFYTTGEIIQGMAVRSARQSIRKLLELNVKTATRIIGDSHEICKPEEINIGDILLVKPGELIPLDGIYIENETALIDSSNISGESLPLSINNGEVLMAGMICLERPIKIKVSAIWSDSHINKIMKLVEESSKRKAKTQRLISRLASVYTPIVFSLAFLLVVLPLYFDPFYDFNEWLYRGLVFLVISCPCAFLIAIPLSYFGGIGLAAKNGVLFKGGEVLEKMAKVKAMVFDKTGTLTEGEFSINKIDLKEDSRSSLSMLFATERYSNHPLSKSIIKELKEFDNNLSPEEIKEFPGKGIQASFDGNIFRAGTKDWLRSFEEDLGIEEDDLPSVHISYMNKYLGKVDFIDKAKDNALEILDQTRKLGVEYIAMLSGDKNNVAHEIGEELRLNEVYGQLLPEDKVDKYMLIRDRFNGAAFIGDGINDAPVIAMADIGIAMGNRGSDAVIQNADLIIENDDLSKIPLSIRIARFTQRNVFQNLLFAIIVKLIVLTLGALGHASLWGAIFADVGVALLVVLNAYSLKNKTGVTN